ncbi:MAG: hypothetical protein KF901_07735 [Myxococcales bacterium]|nr:hypothetical protein [Myxococcales bacterium]
MARALALVPFFVALMTLLAACGDDNRGGGGGTGCSPACSPGEGCCNRMCVALNSTSNCGRCGVVCSSGQTCQMGMCVGGTTMGDGGTTMSTCTPECSASQRCCGGSCVDRQAPAGTMDGRSHPSFQNCNGCGVSCDPDRASVCGATGCMCGATAQCPTGQICGVNPAGVVSCVSTEFDRNNCGGVGIVCGEGESCVSGVCACGTTGMRCAAGQACCGGACVDVATDGMNCGACGNVCGSNAPNCNAGSCTCEAAGRACAEPMAGIFGMGGSTGESCCAGMGCVANTNASCECAPCGDGTTCGVAGGGLIPGMGDGTVRACCGTSTLGHMCAGDSPFPFPFP